ncbi:MAG: hypothetical protein JW996_00710, partial [Candidatus Cloacimonetes bacterium]|nr:hypothetical protein [Candidatus Cloacimonadota bacterium]
MKHYIIIFLSVILILNISCRKQTEKSIPEIDPFIYKSGSLQKGETLANALIDRDIENGKVYQAVNILDKIYNLRRSHPGDSFTVKIDTLGIIHELIYKPDQQHIYSVIRDTLDQFYTKIDTVSFKKIIQICEGEIESSLYQAIIDQGEGSA